MGRYFFFLRAGCQGIFDLGWFWIFYSHFFLIRDLFEPLLSLVEIYVYKDDILIQIFDFLY